MIITAYDGLELDVFASNPGSATTLIFVNALGIGNEIAEALGLAVGRKGINFVTWGLRGSPGPYAANFREYSTLHHIADLTVVAEAHRHSDIVVAGWCSGVEIAIGAVAMKKFRASGLMLFNSPYYFGDAQYRGVKGDALHKLSAFLLKNENRLPFLYQAIGENAEQEAIHKLGINDAVLRHRILAPFLTGEANLLRYACLMHNTIGTQAISDWCKDLDLPTQVIGGECDQMVSYEDSYAIAHLIRNSRIKVMRGWDHYSVCTDAGNAAVLVARFLDTLGLTAGRGESQIPRELV